MMIDDEFTKLIQTNKKDAVLNLLDGCNREGVKDLISFLDEKSGFFESPASSRFHLPFSLPSHDIE